MTLNPYLNRFRIVKLSNCAMSWNALDILTALFPVLPVVWQRNMESTVEKYLLKTPGNGISETLNFKMSLDASALKNLCLWCEFQSQLLFIISLLLKNFLTALHGCYEVSHKWKEALTGRKLASLSINRIVLNRWVHIVKEVIYDIYCLRCDYLNSPKRWLYGWIFPVALDHIFKCYFAPW